MVTIEGKIEAKLCPHLGKEAIKDFAGTQITCVQGLCPYNHQSRAYIDWEGEDNPKRYFCNSSGRQ